MKRHGVVLDLSTESLTSYQDLCDHTGAPRSSLQPQTSPLEQDALEIAAPTAPKKKLGSQSKASKNQIPLTTLKPTKISRVGAAPFLHHASQKDC